MYMHLSLDQLANVVGLELNSSLLTLPLTLLDDRNIACNIYRPLANFKPLSFCKSNPRKKLLKTARNKVEVFLEKKPVRAQIIFHFFRKSEE